MNQDHSRRNFIRNAAIAGIGVTLANQAPFYSYAKNKLSDNLRIGIIGLDTSHSVAFVQALNKDKANAEYMGYKVVAAYPQGSRDIQTSVERIPGYTTEVKKLGVEIVGSIKDLLKKVDVVMLETNDGRLHLEQATEVLKSGKRLFIDKPIAASLADAIAIFEVAKKYNVPIFSSSSLRFTAGAQAVVAGSVGKVLGADAYSPEKFEKTHPDLFWYGIHGVETLFTVMGTGCKTVSRFTTPGADVVVGIWEGERIGTFRGLHDGKQQYGGTVFGDKGVTTLGAYGGYDPLLIKVLEFFKTGIPPVTEKETLEICAFMEAADESKKNNGAPISMDDMYKRAKAIRK
ncbi:Gfo/Idh/MocA family protein [Mucilaginibacter boryungensis]|uniref:Gfo/Idh/MocA family oxidoreductase n=1 Tax=Mucilaginibacter boryungensis TaxID=768480 RepID=A0ABR9XJP5_9SPHI|nr:Gfo/Idh/MocA family oxidoreductase [Mucilaginibacter boryungensis]MBE9667611.1 Gfo/Idh/MocA family oxidoreductase [Mucilaginibacter boryungensis]